MDELTLILILTLVAGLAMPLGASIAVFEHIRPRWLENEIRHGIIAFGGGALLSAVALVLVPESTPHLSIYAATISFLGGGLAFMSLDIFLAKQATSASQLSAMLSDFIPEALALGASFSISPQSGLLLAGIITLQNIPEGFNAYRELKSSSHYSSAKILGAFLLMALLGPVMGLIGYFWLSEQVTIIASIMLFAAGGILYLIFQDIAPQAKLRKHWAPPMGAVMGFLMGMLGQMLLTA